MHAPRFSEKSACLKLQTCLRSKVETDTFPGRWNVGNSVWEGIPLGWDWSHDLSWQLEIHVWWRWRQMNEWKHVSQGPPQQLASSVSNPTSHQLPKPILSTLWSPSPWLHLGPQAWNVPFLTAVCQKVSLSFKAQLRWVSASLYQLSAVLLAPIPVYRLGNESRKLANLSRVTWLLPD